jgi:hypothetical protein
VVFTAGVANFQIVNYTRDNATGSLTLSQSLSSDRTTGSSASGVTRSAWFMSSSTNANKNNVLHILNTSSLSGSLSATVYDENGSLMGSANKALGTLAAHQMLSYTSAQFEAAIGFTPAAPTSKDRAVLTATLPSLELVNFTRDLASGNLTLVQAQVDDRPASSETSSTRNALLIYPSTNTSKTTALRIINPNASAMTVTATVYNEAGTTLITNGALGTVGANQILVLTSSQIEAALGYAPASANALTRLSISANAPNFEVVNDAKDVASGNLYLAQAQTDNRATSSAVTTTRNAYILYPSNNPTTTSQLQIINTTASSGSLTASAYDDSGTLLASNVALASLGGNQMTTLSSAQLESLMAYTPPSSNSTWRIILTANLANFEIINFARDVASGLLVLAQPQTE